MFTSLISTTGNSLNEVEYISKVQCFSDDELEYLYKLINKDPHYCIALNGESIFLTPIQSQRIQRLFSAVRHEMNTRVKKAQKNFYNRLFRPGFEIFMQEPEI